ncbi:uncharacterized protein B0T23DRAFT_382636 [Neurospora hispaniola]|uniref:Uncharacterized protein n=1 Tax=Neurospora hispaniola TaxID=588809 RepID=A0AAJ0I657_9PEZI|nr:hypothetical protein B0T23DRAFT_382636 [Neurospora hispaniola]
MCGLESAAASTLFSGVFLWCSPACRSQTASLGIISAVYIIPDVGLLSVATPPSSSCLNNWDPYAGALVSLIDKHQHLHNTKFALSVLSIQK